MARTRAPRRLQDILDAALQVFSSAGYRRARMHDVAEAAGVSPGLLYTYAAGKEALFSLVIQREAGVDVDALPLPIPNPDTRKLEAVVDRALRTIMRAPALDAAEKQPAADARAELAAVIAEMYDGVNRGRRLTRVIERTALDWLALAARFYNRGRKPFVKRLGRYIARRVASGDFHAVPDPDVAGRFMLETVAWFADHRYGDHDGAAIDDAVARATVIELVTNSVLAR